MASFCQILFFCGRHTEFLKKNYFPFFEITDVAPRGSKSPWVSESLVHPSQIIIIIMNTAAESPKALGIYNKWQRGVGGWRQMQVRKTHTWTGVLTVFAHHRFANQSGGGWIIPSSLFARLANQYFGINEQSVTNKSFRNTRLSGRLHFSHHLRAYLIFAVVAQRMLRQWYFFFVSSDCYFCYNK